MGWRGMLRSLQASSRRAERDAYRRRRALEKQRQQLERMEEYERVRYEVELYENQMELLVSVHKECGEQWGWEDVKSARPPRKPERDDYHEHKAQKELDEYEPSMMDKLFGKSASIIEGLEQAVEDGKRRDKKEYHHALDEYDEAREDWEQSRRFAERILALDTQAYVEALEETDPFGDLKYLGSSIHFRFPNADVAMVELRVNGEKVIPSHIKTQLKSGGLSVKPLPKGRFYEIYQDYVCGCVLRVARELFALLPLKMVVVTALGDILNTATGHLEEQAVLSVAVPWKTAKRIQWEDVDPSDTMANFVHRMCFKKGKGLFAVEPIQLSELHP